MEILCNSLPAVSMLHYFMKTPDFIYRVELWSTFKAASSRCSKTRIFVETIFRDTGVTAEMFFQGLMAEEPDLVHDLSGVSDLMLFLLDDTCLEDNRTDTKIQIQLD